MNKLLLSFFVAVSFISCIRAGDNPEIYEPKQRFAELYENIKIDVLYHDTESFLGHLQELYKLKNCNSYDFSQTSFFKALMGDIPFVVATQQECEKRKIPYPFYSEYKEEDFVRMVIESNNCSGVEHLIKFNFVFPSYWDFNIPSKEMAIMLEKYNMPQEDILHGVRQAFVLMENNSDNNRAGLLAYIAEKSQDGAVYPEIKSHLEFIQKQYSERQYEEEYCKQYYNDATRKLSMLAQAQEKQAKKYLDNALDAMEKFYDALKIADHYNTNLPVKFTQKLESDHTVHCFKEYNEQKCEQAKKYMHAFIELRKACLAHYSSAADLRDYPQI